MADATEIRNWSDSPVYGITRQQARAMSGYDVAQLIARCLDRIGSAGSVAGNEAYLLFWEVRLEALTDEIMDRFEAYEGRR